MLLIITFLLSLTIGYFLLSILKNKNIRQSVSHFVGDRHKLKEGTPTMGGLIFLLTFYIIFFYLITFNKIKINASILIVCIGVLFYTFLGFIDDYLKTKYHNNKGLSIKSKLLLEILFSLLIYLLYKIYINDNTIVFLSLKIDLKYMYGIFIFIYIVTMTNAVNITDGLDGLATSLSIICLITIGILSYFINNDISLLCFIMVASLLGFLFFNKYPAKIFMGDLGSLALGTFIALIAIVIKKEILVIFICIIFILELLSSFIQIISIKFFHKKIFLKAPFHHHLEQKNYGEVTIVKIFFNITLIINLIILIIEYYL